ncbi:hypothetical protein EH223_08230 [candidate division KSB1 bacterium]|nr:zf-HC2 domain-containing protein [candidate division KSB1 bacterium]RQW04178.1 MAG: hypothetical protein EH223_08230 [candidate division KSB1 bacterium]
MLTPHLSDDQIQAFLDDTLPSSDKLSIKAHLQSCAECERAVASYQDVFEALDCDENFDLSKNFTRKVLRQTHKQAVGALQFGLLHIFFILAAVIAVSHVLLTYVNIENFAGTAQATSGAFETLVILVRSAFENLGDKIQFDGIYFILAFIGLLGLFVLDRLVLKPHFKTSP